MDTICRVCDSTHLELAIDLGHQPWCNNFLKPEQVGQEPFYPLRVLYCHDCGTVQLDYTVKKEIMLCLLYTSTSPLEGLLCSMPSSA